MKLIPANGRRPGGCGARRKVPASAFVAALALSLALGMLGSSAAGAAAGTATAGRLAAQPARAVARQSASPACPWLNQALSVSARVKLLLA